MSNAEKGLPLFLALDALPEAYVTEAELPEKPDKKPSLWERINTNGWIAAAIGLVVALGVVTLIVLAGRGAGGPGVAGTSAPVIPEDAPYVFAFEDQAAVPIEGMWWYSGKTADGAYVDADGFGLSPNLLTMDDPPTIVLRAEDAARLQFICRTGEAPGEVNLWDADGEYLSNGHDFSFLSNVLRGKPGTYFVTVNIARKTDAGSGEYTEGIRLIIGVAENDTAPIQTEDEPYVFVYRDQTALPLMGMLWTTDGNRSGSGDGLPDALFNGSDTLPTIYVRAEDSRLLQFVNRTADTVGDVTLLTADGRQTLASGSDFNFLPAYFRQNQVKGSAVYFLYVQIYFDNGTWSGCHTEGIRLVVWNGSGDAHLLTMACDDYDMPPVAMTPMLTSVTTFDDRSGTWISKGFNPMGKWWSREEPVLGTVYCSRDGSRRICDDGYRYVVENEDGVVYTGAPSGFATLPAGTYLVSYKETQTGRTVDGHTELENAEVTYYIRLVVE